VGIAALIILKKKRLEFKKYNLYLGNIYLLICAVSVMTMPEELQSIEYYFQYSVKAFLFVLFMINHLYKGK
jgi:hypothetical protein